MRRREGVGRVTKAGREGWVGGRKGGREGGKKGGREGEWKGGSEGRYYKLREE